MVARQLKIVSQINAFTISASRNLQYVFKKLVCLMVFVKGIFDTYLNNIYESVHEIYNNVVCETSKASDQPAYMCSLIRAFACRSNIL